MTVNFLFTAHRDMTANQFAIMFGERFTDAII